MHQINPADAQRIDDRQHEAAHAASEIIDTCDGATTWAEVFANVYFVLLIVLGICMEKLRHYAPLLIVAGGFGVLLAVHLWRAA